MPSCMRCGFLFFIKGANNFGTHRAALWNQIFNMNTNKSVYSFVKSNNCVKKKRSSTKQDDDRACFFHLLQRMTGKQRTQQKALSDWLVVGSRVNPKRRARS